MCSLATRDEQIVLRSARIFSFLPRYALRPGHAIVVVNEHVTQLGQLAPAVWLEACAEAQRLAALLEARLAPVRCYVAALGTSEHDVPMSSPHLHLHVVPILEAGSKPSDVLTWKHGVYERELDELTREAHSLRA